MEEQLICPYCGAVQYNHEPETISGYTYSTVCESCDKTFWYAVKVTRSYAPYVEDPTKETL